MNVDEFRATFPVTRARAYLFSGAIGPASRRTEAALNEWTRQWASRPLINYDAAFGQIASLRVALGRLFAIDPTRVSLADNTSRASNTAVRLLGRSARSNVVVD